MEYSNNDSNPDIEFIWLYCSTVLCIQSIEGFIIEEYVSFWEFHHEYGFIAQLTNSLIFLFGAYLYYAKYYKILVVEQKTRVIVVSISIVLIYCIIFILILVTDVRLNFFLHLILVPGIVIVIHALSKNIKPFIKRE